MYGYAGADGRPFAAASVKHGIVVGEVSLLTLPSHRHSEDGRLHPASASDAGNKVRTKLTYLFGLVVIATLQGHFLVASNMLCHASIHTTHITLSSLYSVILHYAILLYVLLYYIHIYHVILCYIV